MMYNLWYLYQEIEGMYISETQVHKLPNGIRCNYSQIIQLVATGQITTFWNNDFVADAIHCLFG